MDKALKEKFLKIVRPIYPTNKDNMSFEDFKKAFISAFVDVPYIYRDELIKEKYKEFYGHSGTSAGSKKDQKSGFKTDSSSGDKEKS